MDPLYILLRTRPIQMGGEMSMEPYLNRQFGLIDNPDCEAGTGSVPTLTRTQRDGPEPLLTLVWNEVMLPTVAIIGCPKSLLIAAQLKL